MKPNPAQAELRRQYIELRDRNAHEFSEVAKLMLKVYDKQLFTLVKDEDRAELTTEYKSQRDSTAQKFREVQEALKLAYEEKYKELEDTNEE